MNYPIILKKDNIQFSCYSEADILNLLERGFVIVKEDPEAAAAETKEDQELKSERCSKSIVTKKKKSSK